MEFSLDFIQVFFIIFAEFIPLFLTFFVPILILGQIVGKLEGWTRFDSFYWSIITATTVGYGDFRPHKRASKILSLFIVFIGIVITGLMVAMAVQTGSLVVKYKGGPNGNADQVIEKIQEAIE